MALVRSGNTLYFDAAGTIIDDKNVQVLGILVTGNGGAAVVALGDLVAAASYPSKLNLQAASGATEYFDFSGSPIVFSNGVRATTVTNAICTLVYRST